MKVSPCISLHFDGRCEEAFLFYEQCFGAKIIYRLTWADSPMAKDAPPDWGEKMMHARLSFGETSLTGGDILPSAYRTPSGFGINLSIARPEDADRLFHALSEHGTVHVPLQQTFWSVRYGYVVDQFGIPWEINCEKTAP